MGTEGDGEAHLSLHRPGKPDKLLLPLGSAPLLLGRGDVGILLLEQWWSQAMMETYQFKLRKDSGDQAGPRALLRSGESQGHRAPSLPDMMKKIHQLSFHFLDRI